MDGFWSEHGQAVRWALLVAVAFGLSYWLTGDVIVGIAAMIGHEAAARIALAKRVDRLETERRRWL